MWKFNFMFLMILLSIFFQHINAAKEGWRAIYNDRGFPYIASVQYTKDNPSDPDAVYVHKCTGSIIHRAHILTSASCFDDLDENVQLAVNLGSIEKYGRTPSSQFILVKEKIIHPHYNKHDQRANVAILKLQEQISFRRSIQAIGIPKDNVQPQDQGILYGWNGRLRKTQRKTSKKLYIARVAVLPMDECRDYYPELLDDQFCVAGIKTIDGPCKGTPGIPFQQIMTSMFVPIVGGIATHWPEDCEGPALFTALHSYFDFIQGTYKE